MAPKISDYKEFDRHTEAILGVILKWKPEMIAKGYTKGKIKCPLCNTRGSLHLRLYLRNSRTKEYHMHARCDTPNCLMFME